MKLGAPVVPFYPFSFGFPLLKPNSRKKGTLIIRGLLGNLGRGSGSVSGPAAEMYRLNLGQLSATGYRLSATGYRAESMLGVCKN